MRAATCEGGKGRNISKVSATIFRDGHGVLNAGCAARPGSEGIPLVYMRELAPGRTAGGGRDRDERGAWRFHVTWATRSPAGTTMRPSDTVARR